MISALEAPHILRQDLACYTTTRAPPRLTTPTICSVELRTVLLRPFTSILPHPTQASPRLHLGLRLTMLDAESLQAETAWAGMLEVSFLLLVTIHVSNLRFSRRALLLPQARLSSLEQREHRTRRDGKHSGTLALHHQ